MRRRCGWNCIRDVRASHSPRSARTAAMMSVTSGASPRSSGVSSASSPNLTITSFCLLGRIISYLAHASEGVEGIPRQSPADSIERPWMTALIRPEPCAVGRCRASLSWRNRPSLPAESAVRPRCRRTDTGLPRRAQSRALASMLIEHTQVPYRIKLKRHAAHAERPEQFVLRELQHVRRSPS